MGAEFNTIKLPIDRREAVKRFEEAQATDRYENGHSYSGGIGMASGLRFTDRKAASKKEAMDWLIDNAQKWEDALAVMVVPPIEKGKEAVEPYWLAGAWCSS